MCELVSTQLVRTRTCSLTWFHFFSPNILKFLTLLGLLHSIYTCVRFFSNLLQDFSSSWRQVFYKTESGFGVRKIQWWGILNIDNCGFIWWTMNMINRQNSITDNNYKKYLKLKCKDLCWITCCERKKKRND